MSEQRTDLDQIIATSVTGDLFSLDIEWERPGLPSLVGPFPNREQADEWAGQNIPNGTWTVRRLAWPYYRRPERSR